MFSNRSNLKEDLGNFYMVSGIDLISFCYATLSSVCYQTGVIYSKDNRFQLIVGIFAQNKSPSTLFC